MFIHMDYKKHYNLIVERARARNSVEFGEKHHIIPRCLGGSDDTENIVELTPEEHYVCHQLLVKIHPNNDSLIFAAAMMIPNRPNNKMYGWLKRKRSNSLSKISTGSKNSQFGTIWITDGKTNRKIKKDSSIPLGWMRGRNIPTMQKKQRSCVHCKQIFVSPRKRKFCSRKCFEEENIATISRKVSESKRGKPRTLEDREKISRGMKNYHNNKLF